MRVSGVQLQQQRASDKFVENKFNHKNPLMFQIHKRASEVQPDDGGKEMRVERRDDQSVQLYPVKFFVSGGEKQETTRSLRVTDRNRNVRVKDGNQFRPGDDEKDRNERDKAPRQLQARSFTGTDDGVFESARSAEAHQMFAVMRHHEETE